MFVNRYHPYNAGSLTYSNHWRPLTLMNVNYKISWKAIAKIIKTTLNTLAQLAQLKQDSLKEGVLVRISG